MWPACSSMPWKPPAGSSATALTGRRRAVLQAIICGGATLALPRIACGQSQEEIEAALELFRYRLLQTGSRLRDSYPEDALQQRLQGDVSLELVIGPDGKLRSSGLLTSSGYARLDDTARDVIDRALPLTEIPSTLQNKAFAVRVTVVFRLP